MSNAKWILVAAVLAGLLTVAGCAREAEEKMGEAGQDVAEAWEAERAAAAREMRATVDAVSRDVKAIRDKAAELEARGEAALAAEWHKMADGLEAARDEAARELRALENATAEGWRAARDSARAAVDKLEATWQKEKDAAVAAMKKAVETAEADIAAVRAKAVELEERGEEAAAKAWHAMADRMEAAREAAASGLRKVEGVAEDAFFVTLGAAALAVHEVGELGSHAAAFAAEARDEFVAGARAVVEKTEQELAVAKEKLAGAEEAAKEEWQALVSNLEAAREKAAAELTKIEQAGEGAWAEMRHGFVAAYHDLRDASKRAAERLSEI